MWTNAGDNVIHNALGGNHHVQSPHRIAPTQRVATYGVVGLLEAIEREGYGTQACPHKRVHTLTGEQHAIGNNTPRIASLVEFVSHRFEVFATKGLAAGDDNHHPVGVDVWGYLVDGPQKIFGRHVGHGGTATTIAPAVATIQVATQRTFPENLAQLMLLCKVFFDASEEVERKTFAQADFGCFTHWFRGS